MFLPRMSTGRRGRGRWVPRYGLVRPLVLFRTLPSANLFRSAYGVGGANSPTSLSVRLPHTFPDRSSRSPSWRTVTPLFSLLCGAFVSTTRHIAWLTHTVRLPIHLPSKGNQNSPPHVQYPQCTRCQPPVDRKPTSWLSTFAARSTQVPTLAADHFIVAAKRWSSQRLSGTVACPGWATRIVRSGRVALPG